MKAHDPALDTAILALVIGAADPAYPLQHNPPPLPQPGNLSRNPCGDLEPPVKGRFEKSVGTFDLEPMP
jgi:hypothetical protein